MDELNNLQRLRIDAGYKSLSSFAEALGVSTSAYSRYEQAPENIPTKHLPKMADLLGCSIDAILGRAGSLEQTGPVQAAYNALSEENQKLMDAYIEFLQKREKDAAEERQKRDAVQSTRYARRYLYDFVGQLTESNEKWLRLSGPERQRDSFRRYVEDRVEKEAEQEAMHAAHEVEQELRAMPSLFRREDGGYFREITNGMEYEIEVTHQRQIAYTKSMSTAEKRTEEIIGSIMRGYDFIVAQDGEDVMERVRKSIAKRLQEELKSEKADETN